MGKKIFFLSLILLSVSMGLHWNKNKPKTAPRNAKQRTALNLKDLMLKDKEEKTQTEKEEEPLDGEEDISENEGNEEPEEGEESEGEGDEETEIAEKPEEPGAELAAAVASPTTGLPPSLMGDNVIAALYGMKRNPFQTSPYAQLVVEIQKREEEASKPVEKKEVKLLNAKFSATIKTSKELVAVIDSRLYRKGDLFNNMKIVDVKPEVVALKKDNKDFLLPKFGVKIDIDAETGQYSVEDDYHKK